MSSSDQDRFGLYNQGGEVLSSSMDDEELQEDDIWGGGDHVFKNDKNSFSKSNPKKNGKLKESSSFSLIPLSSSTASSARLMMIPKKSIIVHDDPRKVQHSSAPMSIPDWSKIYGISPKGSSKNNSSWLDDDGGGGGGGGGGISWESDEDGDDGKMVPPHELTALKLARNQMSPSSMCEGYGRTLKGRDQLSVRNVVLTKTGFLEK